MPYQVLGARSGAFAVTATCTRSARARSSSAMVAMLSRTACSPSAFLAPLRPRGRRVPALQALADGRDVERQVLERLHGARGEGEGEVLALPPGAGLVVARRDLGE